ncbi:hypothetical protein RSOL_055890 [Rhizoctonia solani AG-3 Rhs1AP]|uniref:Uncharacterized protein n=2 Tax=Rhizoctonia solani AG-3 TaxID=1086053 RepID=A0A074RNI2_9AGAM|nr:hypothetical protein RSOL_055890 [Rhizoctonia solani AG-3 Rhs1AP]KEP48636.1 hypothetical protein V565_119770 [Rhizoctonia solani 123E]
MSAELFDYIHAVKPSLSDEKRAKIGMLLTHYITLARASDGRVSMHNILTASGESFVRKVLRNMPLVRTLAFALKVDMTCRHDDGAIPKGLRRLCEQYNIDVEACASRHKKLESARSEMWDLVVFVRVALVVMAALHEDTLRELDESYHGHRPAGYKPERKWHGLGVEHATAPVRARDVARARASRAGLVVVSESMSGPIRMVKQTSDNPSMSSGSSGSKYSSYKHRAAPYPTSTPPRECIARSRPRPCI